MFPWNKFRWALICGGALICKVEFLGEGLFEGHCFKSGKGLFEDLRYSIFGGTKTVFCSIRAFRMNKWYENIEEALNH